jgi:hypothetical protein
MKHPGKPEERPEDERKVERFFAILSYGTAVLLLLTLAVVGYSMWFAP